MNDKTLTGKQVQLVAEAIGTMSGITDALLAGKESELAPKSDRDRHLAEILQRVHGNRPDSARLKFSDARLFVAAVMRDCLERIEAA